MNRLLTATEGATWSQNYSYDQYGNRAVTGYIINSALTPQSLSAFNAATNRIIASSYDTSGNQTQDQAGRLVAYDAENHQTNFNSGIGTYSYDCDGRRVQKTDSTGTTVFVYDVATRLIAEYHSDPVPPPAGGGGTSYLITDHLGSTRVVTDSSGNVKARYDYLPFGEEIPTDKRPVGIGYGGSDSTKQKFTQKERDIESGLDYFLARYYSSAHGRFTSPDEFTGGPDEFYDFADKSATNPTFYADLTDPQSLNKYQYCYNNPLLYIDPNGHQGLREFARKVGNAAYQVGKDTVVGGAKELYNAAVGVPNAINTVVDAGLSLTGTDFRFGQLPTAQASTPGESSAMLAVDVALIYQAATSLAAGEAASAVNAGRAATERAAGEARTPATQPYRRPSGATTAEQRASVQGQPCVECGKTAPKMVANHKTPLVQEHYQTEKIDTHRMRQVSAVNSHCRTCSAREGARMSRYSREMRRKLPAQQ